MVLTSMGQKQTLKQMPLAEFWYEIFESRGRYLNLYDRVSSEQGKGVLRFLVQVPVDTNCIIECSVRQAVDKVYEGLELPIMRIQARGFSDGFYPPQHFDYLR